MVDNTYLQVTGPSGHRKLPDKAVLCPGWPQSARVTSFCINLALLRRMEARNLEKDPLRRVRPIAHFYFNELPPPQFVRA